VVFVLTHERNFFILLPTKSKFNQRTGAFAPRFKCAKIKNRLSAVLQFYTPILETVAGRVLIAGDAANYIEAYNQGGIMYGCEDR
jgi:flavin-dependent dehydrogenase